MISGGVGVAEEWILGRSSPAGSPCVIEVALVLLHCDGQYVLLDATLMMVILSPREAAVWF